MIKNVIWCHTIWPRPGWDSSDKGGISGQKKRMGTKSNYFFYKNLLFQILIRYDYPYSLMGRASGSGKWVLFPFPFSFSSFSFPLFPFPFSFFSFFSSFFLYKQPKNKIKQLFYKNPKNKIFKI